MTRLLRGFILLMYISFGSALVAQTGTIKVLSKEDLAPVEFAYVNILSGDNKPIKTLLTNELGEVVYEYGEKGKEFQIAISFVGCKTIKDVLVSGSDKTFYLEKNPFAIDPVVVTAEYAPIRSEKSVYKVKIITQEQIEERGAVTLRDVLTNENNVRLSQDNVLGSSLSLQGISGQNVKILMDGVPMIGRLDGNIDLSQINLNNVERIEIVEGPLSVNFGTDALAGTINIITKKNIDNNYTGSVEGYYESVGQYNVDGQLGWKKNKNTVLLSGGRNYFDGWSDGDPVELFPVAQRADHNRFKQWNPKEQLFAQGQFIRDIKDVKLSIGTNLFNEVITNRGMPREPFFQTAFDDVYHTWRWDKTVTFVGPVAEDRNVALYFAQNDFRRTKNTFFRDLTDLSEQLTNNPSDQDTSTFNLWLARGTYSTSFDSSLVNYEVGYDLKLERGTGQRIEGGESQIGDYAGFMSIEFRPKDHFTLKAGVRGAHNTSYRHPLIPSLNVRYRINNTTLRASYARGFRAPSIKELYFEFVDINHNVLGNPDLQAENSNNFQLSLARRKFNNKYLVTYELSAFYNEIENMISLSQSEGTLFSYFNIQQFRTQGTQLNIAYTFERLKVSLGGAYTGRFNSLSNSADVDAFSYSPEILSSINYHFKKLDIRGAAFYKYNGTLPGFYTDDQGLVQESEISDYHNLDISFTKTFINKKIECTLGAKNLFDVRNINATSTVGATHSSSSDAVAVSWGRTFFTSIKLNLAYDSKKKN